MDQLSKLGVIKFMEDAPTDALLKFGQVVIARGVVHSRFPESHRRPWQQTCGACCGDGLFVTGAARDFRGQ